MTLPSEAEHPGATALIESVKADVVAVLGAIGDPTQRALEAWRAIEAITELRGEIVDVRQVAFSTVRVRHSMSWAQLGAHFGVSATRARQITTGER